jgi:hypothetical protein
LLAIADIAIDAVLLFACLSYWELVAGPVRVDKMDDVKPAVANEDYGVSVSPVQGQCSDFVGQS